MAAIATTANAGSANADVISNFDFTGPPWAVAKEANFNIFAANALSVDVDINSLTSPLTNNAGTGAPYNGGGYASFCIRDADLTFDPAIFSTLDSKDSIMLDGTDTGVLEDATATENMNDIAMIAAIVLR